MEMDVNMALSREMRETHIETLSFILAASWGMCSE